MNGGKRVIMMYRFKSEGAVSRWYPVSGLAEVERLLCDHLSPGGDNTLEFRFMEPGSEYDTTEICTGREALE